MAATAKLAYAFRFLVLFFSGAAMGSCIWMLTVYRDYPNVIMRWKYRVEFPLACITFFAYIATFFVQRLSRPRSKTRSIVFLTLGCIMGVLWLHTCLRILIDRERQVLPVDHPYRDRRNFPWWSDFETPIDHSLFHCTPDPASSLGASLSETLCNIDRSAAFAGALCGLFVILESCLSYVYEKRVRAQHDQQQQYGDYSLGYTSVMPPPAVIVAPMPVDQGAHAVVAPPFAPPPPPAAGAPYQSSETVPAYASQIDMVPLTDDKRALGTN